MSLFTSAWRLFLWLLLVSCVSFKDCEPFGDKGPFIDLFSYVSHFVSYFLLKISINTPSNDCHNPDLSGARIFLYCAECSQAVVGTVAWAGAGSGEKEEDCFFKPS